MYEMYEMYEIYYKGILMATSSFLIIEAVMSTWSETNPITGQLGVECIKNFTPNLWTKE